MYILLTTFSFKPPSLLDEIPERGGLSFEGPIGFVYGFGNVGLEGSVILSAHRSYVSEGKDRRACTGIYLYAGKSPERRHIALVSRSQTRIVDHPLQYIAPVPDQDKQNFHLHSTSHSTTNSPKAALLTPNRMFHIYNRERAKV